MYIKRFFSQFLIFLVFASFFTGCRKDSPLPSTVTISKVRSQITSSPTGVPDTVIYAYDITGRQVRSQTDTLVTIYSYSSTGDTMTNMLHGLNFLTTYTTDPAGRATSDSKGFIYAYNGGGYLINYSYTGAGVYDSTSYTISGGNVDTSVRHQTVPATDNLITTSYTYLPTIDSRDFGLAFLGRQNTNLISTETVTQLINGSTYTVHYTYSYTFDSQGRVAQQVQSSGTATYTTAYTYY